MRKSDRSPELSSHTCPLCEQTNNCHANSKKPCWCMDMEIPTALIQRARQESGRERCICKQCIQKHYEQAAQQ